MKFSILIPVYNVERYIRECLESVMNQSYFNYEVVLVDDGSTDNSGKICDEWLKKYPERIRVIHKQNQGLISARRIGIENANGEFCVFVDSDDYIEHDLLESISDYLRQDDEIDVVLYSFRYLRNGVKSERFPAAFANGTVWMKDNKKELYEAMLFSNRITAIWTKAIRSSILRMDTTNYSMYYHLNMAEDLLQSLHPITSARKVCYADKILYNYRINGDGISHGYQLNKIKRNSTVHVYYEILKRLPQWEMDTIDTRNHLNARWFNEVAYTFSKCYENASTWEEKKNIVAFEWKQMMPIVQTEDNYYFNTTYSKLMEYQERKAFLLLELYFIRKKYYQFCRKIWRKIRQK